MKKLYLFSIIAFISLSFDINAQTISYDLRCSTDNSKYELYVTRTETTVFPVLDGFCQVTLVLPTGTSRTVSHTSEGTSFNALPVIINPGGNGNDYHGFSTSGGSDIAGDFVANVPTLWMTFTPSDGTTQNTRLFINGTDPEATDTGMSGVNLRNIFRVLTPGGNIDEYNGNDSNVVNCSPLGNNDIASLNNLSLYPNPASNQINITGDISSLEKIEIITVNGKLVKRINTNFNKIDISQLDGAMYFVKLYNTFGVKNLKFIKE